MKASLRWLEAFLRRPLDARDVAARLAMLGAPVDGIEPLGGDLSPFVVALVTEVRPHPNADKLSVTTVDDGSGTLHSVVCGAPNVAAGSKYPFARLGTVMPGGLVIEKRKLRGEPSEGMLCSSRELGLGEEHDGLMTLATEAPPGTPLLEVLDGGDQRLDVDVTPNRPDLMGHKGLARELASSYGVAFRLPEIPDEVALDLPMPARATVDVLVGGVRLGVTDGGCGRFLAGVIRGVRVGPSPAWLRQRLEGAGVRSINNVVDATNYVMLELNQPMHAYDLATLRGPAVMARASRAGEKLVTLDGTTRTLAPGTLVIADAERVIGIAGVMGGRDTEVSASTVDLFLECAWFEPARVRAARRAAGLATDASQRFERGTDRWGAVDAFRRAIRLIVTVAGGVLDGTTVDLFPVPVHPPRIFLRPARVAQVLGVELPWSEIERQLVAIGSTVVAKPEDSRIAVDVPGWRPDITSEIDLIEEIARLYGYDRIPTDLRGFRPGSRDDDSGWGAAERIRLGLAASGLSEVMTMPMVAVAGPAAPRLLNPLSAEHGYLRDALLPALVRQVEANWALHTGDVRLFEVGSAFVRGAPGERPGEAMHAAFVVSGARRPSHWTDGGKPPLWDRWDAVALFEGLVALADPSAAVQVEGDRWVARRPDGAVTGYCAALPADAPPWAAQLFGGEVTVALEASVPRPFLPVPAFPAVTRDLALVLPLHCPVGAVTALLLQRGQRHSLTSVAVVDEYRGEKLPAGRRGVAVRLVFRAPDRTLTDPEVEQAVGRLRTSLERELDVTLRTS